MLGSFLLTHLVTAWIQKSMETTMKKMIMGASGIRLMKALLIAFIALFALLVAINNVFDYQSNFMFVKHVLSMDTTFEGNSLMWRALPQAWVHHFAYLIIIICEFLVGFICAYASFRLFRISDVHSDEYLNAKTLASWGLVLGITLWFGGFMAVGAEWFLMWQSPVWNGQEAAFRFIMCLFGTLIFLNQDNEFSHKRQTENGDIA